ncbi:MAG: glycosyltransferase family 4 protein [Chitinispirillia bacterium]|nr:glycosyltransferase family 4 protein [Chitinispirillia bacterium]
MNILVINWRDIEHPEAGGAEVHVLELFSRLVDKGHYVTLLTTRFKGSSKTAVQRGIEVLRLGRTYTFNWEAPFLVRKLLRQKNYDCVIDDVNKLPFFTSLWFPKVKCGSFFHHLLGKTVFGLTNPPMALYVYLMEKLYPWGYRRVPCCTVSKSTAAELIEKGFNKENISIIENSIDTNHYCPDSSVSREKDLLLYVGRLKKYKRVDIVFEAMSILKKQGRHLRFVIAGNGDDMERLKQRCKELELEDCAAFAGFISEEKKIEYLRKAALFVNTSEKEGWGITNVEAAACGTVVVANDAPGLRDSVINNKTGLLYKENDVESLASTIKKLLDDKDLTKKFGEEGRLWAETFSWDSSAQRIEDWLLKTVCGN